MVAKIYIEGAGRGRDLKTAFGKGWENFFKSAGLHLDQRMPRKVIGLGQSEAVDLFIKAVRNPEEEYYPVLLIDSERNIPASADPIKTILPDLPNKFHDELIQVRDQVFLMIPTMEAWLLADPDGIKSYFGQQAKITSIPAWPNLEQVPKQELIRTLESITTGCKKSYKKEKTSFELLAHIDAKKVMARCPAAKRLIDFLK